MKWVKDETTICKVMWKKFFSIISGTQRNIARKQIILSVSNFQGKCCIQTVGILFGLVFFGGEGFVGFFFWKAQIIINKVRNCHKILKCHQKIAQTLQLTWEIHGMDLTITEVTVWWMWSKTHISLIFSQKLFNKLWSSLDWAGYVEVGFRTNMLCP